MIVLNLFVSFVSCLVVGCSLVYVFVVGSWLVVVDVLVVATYLVVCVSIVVGWLGLVD